MNACADPLINKDGKFSDALQHVFESIETSDIFKPHKKTKPVFYKARRSVKKRITNVINITDLEQEDEGDIFDILENM